MGASARVVDAKQVMVSGGGHSERLPEQKTLAGRASLLIPAFAALHSGWGCVLLKVVPLGTSPLYIPFTHITIRRNKALHRQSPNSRERLCGIQAFCTD